MNITNPIIKGKLPKKPEWEEHQGHESAVPYLLAEGYTIGKANKKDVLNHTVPLAKLYKESLAIDRIEQEKETFTVYQSGQRAKYSLALFKKILADLEGEEYVLKLESDNQPLIIETKKHVYFLAPRVENLGDTMPRIEQEINETESD